MTALPEPPEHPLRPPARLLTVDEYVALGETETGYTELVEGRILMSPSPVPDHNYASGELREQIKHQLPSDFEVIQDVDVNLELVPPGEPGFSRRPDLLIVELGARQRVRREGGMIKASEVRVAIEVVSAGSQRTDYVDKRREYADAEIPHYWIVDLRPPVSLVACRLTEDFGYVDSAEVSDTFTASEPFPVSIDVTRLL
ncbi:MAG: Uma2 family endonuclease [Actinophytocola sp.]|nr:Uma2 family endonuclease [Actinophytocola sp.]